MTMITDELLDRYVTLAASNYEGGMPVTRAKREAANTLGITFDAHDYDLVSRIGQAFRRNGIELKGKPFPNGKNHEPSDGKPNGARVINAADFTRWLFDWVGENRGGYKVGSTYEIWPELLVAITELLTGKRYSEQAFTNEFTLKPFSKLQERGYTFTCLTKKGERPIVFRIDSIPRPPAQVVEEKGPIQPEPVAKQFTRQEAESMATYAANKAVEEFIRKIQLANGRLPF